MLKGPVTLTAQEWRLVLAVNGERDLNAIAAMLQLDNIAALTALAELVRDGIIETAPRPAPPVYEAPAPARPRMEVRRRRALRTAPATHVDASTHPYARTLRRPHRPRSKRDAE